MGTPHPIRLRLAGGRRYCRREEGRREEGRREEGRREEGGGRREEGGGRREEGGGRREEGGGRREEGGEDGAAASPCGVVRGEGCGVIIWAVPVLKGLGCSSH